MCLQRYRVAGEDVRLEVQSDLIVAALLCDPGCCSQLTSINQLYQSTVSLFTHAGGPREVEPDLCVCVEQVQWNAHWNANDCKPQSIVAATAYKTECLDTKLFRSQEHLSTSVVL